MLLISDDYTLAAYMSMESFRTQHTTAHTHRVRHVNSPGYILLINSSTFLVPDASELRYMAPNFTEASIRTVVPFRGQNT